MKHVFTFFNKVENLVDTYFMIMTAKRDPRYGSAEKSEPVELDRCVQKTSIIFQLTVHFSFNFSCFKFLLENLGLSEK
jgi:hypothetical protein